MLRVKNAPTDLPMRIERGVHARTHGRVRDLRVEIAPDLVVLHGRAPTYYTKQLAQAGAMDVLNGLRVVNSIQVS